MQPEERLEAELAGALEHPLGRPHAAALGELHVDAADDADEPPRSSIVTALSSATIGSADRSWSQRSWSSRWAGNGCSISSTPRRTSSGTSFAPGLRAPSRCWRRPGSGRRRRARTASSVSRSARPADLDLEGREVARPFGPGRHDLRLVDADREVRRRDVGRQAEEPMDGQAEPLAERGRGGRCRGRTWRPPWWPIAAAIAAARPERPARLSAGRRGRGERPASIARPAAAGRPRSSRASRRSRRPDTPRRPRRPSGRRRRAAHDDRGDARRRRGCGRSGTGRAAARSRTRSGGGHPGPAIGRREAFTGRVDRRPPAAPERLGPEADGVVGRQAGLGRRSRR